MEIISCQHCQVIEDREIIYGIGKPMLVNELLSLSVLVICPNCQTLLADVDLIFTNLDYDDYLIAEQALRLAA